MNVERVLDKMVRENHVVSRYDLVHSMCGRYLCYLHLCFQRHLLGSGTPCVVVLKACLQPANTAALSARSRASMLQHL
jgi:hypothetical protein